MFIYRDEYYERGLRAPRRGRPDHRQAPQRRGRQGHADLPEGVPEVHELRRRALRAVSGQPFDVVQASTGGPRPAAPTGGGECPLGHLRRQRLPDRRGDEHGARLRLPRGAHRGRAHAEPRRADPPPLPGRLLRPAPGQRHRPDGPRPGPARAPLRARRSTSNLDGGRGLWIQGDVGTGKTTLAMLVSKAALDAGRSVAIYSLPRLLNLLRESMDSRGRDARLPRPPRGGRPAAHRRPRRREPAPTGCSSSSTRSSTRATRPSGRSWRRPT